MVIDGHFFFPHLNLQRKSYNPTLHPPPPPKEKRKGTYNSNSPIPSPHCPKIMLETHEPICQLLIFSLSSLLSSIEITTSNFKYKVIQWPPTRFFDLRTRDVSFQNGHKPLHPLEEN